MIAFFILCSRPLAYYVNVSALTDPEESRTESTNCWAGDCEDELERKGDKGDEEAGWEVEGVGNSGNEHLLLDFPFAGGGVDGREDEGEIADGDVGGPDDR